MNAQDALKLARRFIELPQEKRRLFLEGLQQQGVDFALFPIPAEVLVDERDGLSYAQQRMWFLWQLDPQSAAYNLPMAVRLNGELDNAALQSAFDALVARHETLRSQFSEQDGVVRQRIVEPFAVSIACHDLSALATDAREEQVRTLADAEALAPFDLAHGPLLRVQLLKLADQEHVLLLTLHHIVADGWSYNVLIDEFIRLYDAASSGSDAALQPLPIQYRDYALWQRSWLEAGEQDRQLDYWRAKLGDDHAPLELPIDHSRPVTPSYRGARHEFQVEPALAERLRGLAREQGVTLFMVLLAAFKVLLHRYSGQQAIRVGVPVANRNRAEVEGLIGCFINTQVLHTEIDPLIDVRELLQRVKETALGAQGHQELPFERLVEAFGLDRSLSISPLFQVMFNHQSQVADAGAIKGQSGLSIAALERETRIAQFDLSLDTYEKGGQLFAAFGYATDLFDSYTVVQMAGHFRHILQALVQGSQMRLGELPILGDAQRQEMLYGWNATQVDYPLGRGVHQLIEAQAERTPEAAALTFGSQTLSYAELNARANQFAHNLIARGVKPDGLVGIAVERSIEMVVGLLAILKAGGAYVPLDPEYPTDRLAYMLEDSGIQLLLSQSHLELPLAEGVQRINLDQEVDWLQNHSAANPNVVLTDEHLAYVIYTSGSTGKPKGAGNRHSALTNRLCWMQEAYGLDASDAVVQKTPFSFDVSVWEFFWPLMTGARLVVAQPGDHRDPAKLVELIKAERVTTLHFVPSMLQAFLQDPGVASCTGLKRIVCSGEALPVDAQQQVFALLPDAGLYNLYGPTEAAIDVTHWTCVDEGRDAVPIGQPIANLGCHVLDGNLEPVPIGVLGELYLLGVGLARGYHQRPSLTGERFVASPFGDGARMYRTGDLARYRPDGVIEYVGRIDHQVKLRGLRIELGEIEARLLEHETVREAAVLAVDGKHLVGYVVLIAEADGWREELAAHLAQHVPDYMVPAQWLSLERMPLSPNGKLDRKALPRPDAGPSQHEYVAPQAGLEQRIAAIWQDVLKREQVGRNDNFFELGGDSIVSIQVVSRARQAGIQFTPKDLFQHQTVRSLATVAVVGEGRKLVDQGPVTGETPLTPVQHWFFELPMAERGHWNQSLLLDAREPVVAPVLEKALQHLLKHHDALRLRFVQQNGEWHQYHDDLDTQHPLLWEGPESEAFYAEVQRSLDLSKGPLLRAALLEVEGGGQRLLLAIHHLVVDGVSWRVLLEDLQATYQRLLDNQAPNLPAKTSAYQTWAQRLQAYAQEDSMLHELDDWKARLEDVSQELPRDNPEGGLLNKHGATLDIRLDAERTEQLLKQAPVAYRTQVNDLLLTALSRVLCRWSGAESVLVQMEGHGREELFDDIDLTRTVGWFTSLFPVKLTPATDLATSLKTIKEQLRAVPGKGLGYGVLRYLAPAQVQDALKALPQARVTFNYLGQFDGQFGEKALFVPAGTAGGKAQADDAPLANWLTVEGQVYGGELSLRWGYSTEIYRQETIQRLADEFISELQALIEHCASATAFGVTPSDFPLAKLTQAQLDALPIPARDIEDIYPLSPMQQGMLFHTLYEQEGEDYINQMRVDVEGLDVERFQAAWAAAVARHDILRTGFVWQGDLPAPVQIVLRDATLLLVEHDWRSALAPQVALDELAESERRQGFDLALAPLLRLVLVRTLEQRYHLIMTSHHILLDGWSTSQLLGEVLQHYAGDVSPASMGRYRDYIGWLQAQDKVASESFWKAQLLNLEEPTRLAQAITVESHRRAGRGEYVRVLEAAQTDRLNEFARSQKVTINTLIQAAWLLLLQRYTGQTTVAFGATVAGRPAALKGVETQIGLFINTLPVIACPQPQQRVGDWLQRLQEQNLNLREHEHTPLSDIQRWAGFGSEALFDSLIVFENYPISQALERSAPPGVKFGAVTNQEQTNYPLTLGITLGECLSVAMSFDGAHFSTTTIEHLSSQLRHLLLTFADYPLRSIGEISLASEKERSWHQSYNEVLPFSADVLVHQRFAHLAMQRPEETAVIFDGQRYGYGELNTRANRLAHELVARGVGTETRIGVALPRSEHFIVALLAVLKAGGAYVPLDTSYPSERLAYMMKDAGLSLLLSDSRLSGQLPDQADIAVIELDGLDLGSHPPSAPEVVISPDNLAYVIYTSGSTGNPKGVGVTHGPLAMHCQAIGVRYEMCDSDCEFHFMSFAFDGAHERWLTSLTHGGSLLIRDDSLWTPEQTYKAMIEYGVTVAAFPPVYLQQLAEYAEQVGNPPKVRVYCFGGDAVSSAAFERVKRALNPEYIINGYGPTETVVTPLIWKAGRHTSCEAAYAPIGSRIGSRSAYVLDAEMNLLPRGMAGELYLGGYGVARGYLNRPGLTSERFIADPFCPDGRVLYRTGDRVRQRTDGTFDYLERIDNQVKIRGFRIELGEIEARLQSLDGVREAVVVAQESAGSKRLIAYVVGGSQRSDFAEQLRVQLKDVLPAHMVPAYVLTLEHMPLTPNGKLDRKRLPTPDASQLQQRYVAPYSEIQQQLATIWQDVLKLSRVGLNDNFFELGGDSIISLQVVNRARQVGVRFTPKDIFQCQTIQALAGVAETSEPLQLINQEAVTGKTLLLPVHQWFFTQSVPDRHHWNQSVMLRTTQPLDARVMEQALRALIMHHDSLRLEFKEQASGWTAQYREVDALLSDTTVWQVDVAGLAELEAIGNKAQRSLKLSGGSLIRAVLANLADGSQRLLLIAHHLVVDGVSWRILFEDLQSAYRQIHSGAQVQLPTKTSSVKAWADGLTEYASSTRLCDELEFWRQQLQGACSRLPCDNPQGGQQQCHAQTIRRQLDKKLTRQLLQEAPAAYRTQVNDLLLTALARVMVRWTGSKSVLVQLEGHGREDIFDSVDLTRTVGWFTSLFPARLAPASDLGSSLKQIKEHLRSIPNKGIGFGALACLGDEHTRAVLQALPKPCLTFNYLGQFDGSFDDTADSLFVPTDESGGEEVNMQGPLGSPLALDSKVLGGELDLSWTFSHEMFAPATIHRLADEYVQELTALIAYCCDSANRGVTPSDFALVKLSQAQLDVLVPQPQAIDDIYPLSPMQQGMLFHSLLKQGNGDYINQMCLDVDGIDPDRFHAAWQAVVNTHDILRTGFVWEGDLEQPVQVVQRQVAVPFRVLDWEGLSELEAALKTLANEERAQGLNLANAPLLRLVLVRTAASRYHMIYTNHHILMDGWSSAQLLGEVLQHYRGEAVPIPAGRYRDYIAWLQRQDAGLGEAFWSDQLRSLDGPVLLAKVIAQPAQDIAPDLYAHQHLQLDDEQTRRLGEFARESKVTVNTVVQAAWLLLLQRYTGKSSVVSGATVSGRPADLIGVEQQIGLFINTLPIIISPHPEQSVGDWLHSVQAHNLALREFEHTALFDIQRWAGHGGEALFDSIIVFENYPISDALENGAPEGLRFGEVINLEQTNYPLTLMVEPGRRLTVQFNYQCASFTDAAIKQIGTHLKRLLLQMSSDAKCSLGALNLLDPSESRQQLLEWNATQSAYPGERCIHRLIEARACQAPDAIALVFAGQSMTYSQLNAQANRLAHRLLDYGVRPDQCVGIALERGLEMIIGLLAILKAGGAYVPLDPQYPADRLTHMIEDSGLRLLLTQASLLQVLPIPSDVQTLLPSALDEPIAVDQMANPQVSLEGENLCYVIYTSGSTGKPKGVMVRHGALVNFIASMAREPGMGASDRVLSLTTFSFDIFGLELYGALFSGAAVVLVDKQSAHDPKALLEIIEQNQVSIVQATPSMWRMLLEDPLAERLTGRKCLCGGEALPRDLAECLLQVTADLWNLYGPTETTIWSAAYPMTVQQCVPYLGRPIANTSLFILGEHFLPNPVGLPGELLIGGDGLARGYHGRAALTAERFLPDPFGSGARLYRTGDLARYVVDGTIEYIGRIDHQVKIRGHRIELGEIESCLLAHELIRDAVVIPQEGPGGPQLVAYLVASDHENLATKSPMALREELMSRLSLMLPDYMIPAHWILLERFPLTPNGKLDRKVLPLPNVNQLLRTYTAPQGPLEENIALIWQDVLKVERVGRDDNFFELGGHSLLATQATARLQMAQDATVPLDLLFRTASLSEYAEQLAVHLTPHSFEDMSEMHDFLADLETL
ncbi:non-ribosomal peptide synthase/polyketide synthase [Pseudomonas sp. 21LCFQ010]|uniref:non-ribosomal peptide synthetase n=1 Tax=Pseudomonas sp. 21LCFQ010 TaxID=2957506 RepID=UPI0020970455|nr:non-ribosomal peptide synthase/polyketide synthase [Pseudomonas sp. 21LCFQ010]MCO8162806.1 non-ribosomal peptide synthase/polyketide synthase [Pseudomonas sp. 21LCFQ010]